MIEGTEDALNSVDSVIDGFLETEDIAVTNDKIQFDKPGQERNERIKSSRDGLYKECVRITDDDRMLAVKMNIIPKAYKEAFFDVDRINRNIEQQKEKYNRMLDVVHLDKYIDTCLMILNTLRIGELPNQSYLIGAPNGFGKTSFVTECLITLLRQGYRVVPYITLRELAEIKKEGTSRLMRQFDVSEYRNSYYYRDMSVYSLQEMYDNMNREIRYLESEYKRLEKCILGASDDNKRLALETDQMGIVAEKEKALKNLGDIKDSIRYVESVNVAKFTYQEYLDSHCLFVAFSGVNNKEVESYMLKELLLTRAMKGLPTIVMLSESLEPYKRDRNLRDDVWLEILAFDDDGKSGDTVPTYDRLIHRSTFKINNRTGRVV